MHQQPTRQELEEITEKINKRQQEIAQDPQLSKLPPAVQKRQAERDVSLAMDMEEEEKAVDQMHLENKVGYYQQRIALEEAVEIPAFLNHLRPEEIPLKTLKALWKEQTYNDETGESEPIPI
jgi:hypothetical protein